MTTAKTFTVTVEADITAKFTCELSRAAAKAVCADWLDPDETFDDQVEHTLQTVFESLQDDVIGEALLSAIPTTIEAEPDGQKVQLKLDQSPSGFDVSFETPEVEE